MKVENKKTRVERLIKPLLYISVLLWIATSIFNVISTIIIEMHFKSYTGVSGSLLSSLTGLGFWDKLIVIFSSFILKLTQNSIYFVLFFITIIIMITIYNRFPKIRGEVAIDVENTTKEGLLHETYN